MSEEAIRTSSRVPNAISRRGFLGTGLAAGAGLASWGCRDEGRGSAEAGPSGRQRPTVGPFELDEVTIAELAGGMESGRFTARRIAELYLARIDDLDRSGPSLRSIIETNPDALADADRLDEERRQEGPRGPLHGIPVLLKDNIATADRVMTTAGSLALEGSRPGRDAFVAARLREAGAVLLAKCNLSEWANFRSTRSSSGWSARGGQCRNPYALDRNPCGSSSGSAAATSANLGAVSLGTETDGSVVCPSNANGLVGVKPTVGLVSRSGVVPISHTQDTVGPMTRTVRDAAVLLGAIAGVDPRDEATAAAAGRATDYASALDPNGLAGARIGVGRQFFGFHEDVDRVMEEALDAMRSEGAEIVDVEIGSTDEAAEAEFTVLLYEFKAGLNAYLATLEGARISTLGDAIRFNEENADVEMPYFGQEIFLRAEEKGPLSETPYREALATSRRLSRDEGIDRAVTEHGLDAIVGPTGGPAWTTDLVNGDHFLGGCSGPAARAGYPHVTVPAGLVHGLPVGISFFAGAWSEARLLKLAFAFEQLTKARRKPEFRASVVDA